MRIVAGQAIALLVVVFFAGDTAQELVTKNEHVDLCVYGPWNNGQRRVRAWSVDRGDNRNRIREPCRR